MEGELWPTRWIGVIGRERWASWRLLRQREQHQVPLSHGLFHDTAKLVRNGVWSKVRSHRRIRPRPGHHQVGRRLLASHLQFLCLNHQQNVLPGIETLFPSRIIFSFELTASTDVRWGLHKEIPTIRMMNTAGRGQRT